MAKSLLCLGLQGLWAQGGRGQSGGCCWTTEGLGETHLCPQVGRSLGKGGPGGTRSLRGDLRGQREVPTATGVGVEPELRGQARVPPAGLASWRGSTATPGLLLVSRVTSNGVSRFAFPDLLSRSHLSVRWTLWCLQPGVVGGDAELLLEGQMFAGGLCSPQHPVEGGSRVCSELLRTVDACFLPLL